MSDSTTHRNKTLSLAALGACAMLLSPLFPAASAASTLPPMGMSVDDISDLSAAGASPRYAGYWVGDWMASSGWGGFDAAMRTAKSKGVTPVVYWYYWGDSISSSCIANGCNGRTRAQWTILTNQLAEHLRATLGGVEVLVVIENEFNKNDITGAYAPTFDAQLEAVAKTIKAVPGVKIVTGFGNWGEGNWGKFPRTIAQSSYVGFQMMRASTKDTEASYRDAATRTAYLTGFIATKFNKPSFLYDLALSSYPDAKWANIQAQTLDAIFAKLVTSGATGLQGVVYRTLDDVAMSSANYYGAAESHWGLRTSSKTAKPAFTVWLKYAKGATGTTPAPFSVPTVNGGFSATFAGVKGNAYWVQASVTANKPIATVCASVDGGACQPLTKQSYGYASSFHVPDGAKVTLRATATTGETATSTAYLWPGATPASSAPNSAPAPASTAGSATFAPYAGNEWWVQTNVNSGQTVKTVCASVNAASCTPLTYKTWGAWAASIHAPTGSTVVFKATLADGSIATSKTYTWPVA